MSPLGAKVAPLFVNLLRDSDNEVRAQAAKGLGDINATSAQGVLVKALGDSEPRAQFFAAQSLGKLKDAKAAPALVAFLKTNDNKDSYLRFAASHALVQFGKTPVLEAAAKDASGAVRLGALLAHPDRKVVVMIAVAHLVPGRQLCFDLPAEVLISCDQADSR